MNFLNLFIPDQLSKGLELSNDIKQITKNIPDDKKPILKFLIEKNSESFKKELLEEFPEYNLENKFNNYKEFLISTFELDGISARQPINRTTTSDFKKSSSGKSKKAAGIGSRECKALLGTTIKSLSKRESSL